MSRIIYVLWATYERNYSFSIDTLLHMYSYWIKVQEMFIHRTSLTKAKNVEDKQYCPPPFI